MKPTWHCNANRPHAKSGAAASATYARYNGAPNSEGLRRETSYPVFPSSQALASPLRWRDLMPGTFLRPTGTREPDWLRKEG